MEGIFPLIIAIVIFLVVRRAIQAVFGKGSSSESAILLQAQIHNAQLEDDEGSLEFKEVQVKGLLPIKKTIKVGFVTSILDVTDEKYQPLISSIEQFQEPNNVTFQHKTKIGQVSAGQGILKWVRVGVIFPEILQPPFSGTRKLQIVLRLIDWDNPPRIKHGVYEGGSGLIWETTLDFEYNFIEKGYREAAENKEEAQSLSIKIAIAVAMADGSIDQSEGEVIKRWIMKIITTFSDDRREKLKNLYNSAMREAYKSAKAGELSLSGVTKRLNEIGENKIKYDAMELCLEVMAADGRVDPEEMKIIRMVGEALDLNVDEIEKMKDQKIVSLDPSLTGKTNVEELLGIRSEWDEKRIKQHLRAEFQKWNNRLNSLPEGNERNNAQAMLDLISNARKKYV